MRGILNKIGGAETPAVNLRPLSVEMRPERAFYAIGDVHGCFEQLQDALEKIDIDIEEVGPIDPAVVLLGDYVDRGPKSADVLKYLSTLKVNEPTALVCLRGNHEQMMLDFMDDPVRYGARWLRFGGSETLSSFGIEHTPDEPTKEQLYEMCEELLDALPPLVEPWLRALPARWSSGNLHCVHAAMDPKYPPAQQSEQTMLWGCDTFLTRARDDGQWIVHGHTVVDKPTWENNRVALDTGCYFTGALTVAAFTGQGCRIL